MSLIAYINTQSFLYSTAASYIYVSNLKLIIDEYNEVIHFENCTVLIAKTVFIKMGKLWSTSNQIVHCFASFVIFI